MATIIEFLRARLDEDEQAARAVVEQQPITEWDAVGAGEDDDVSKSWWGVTGIARAYPTPRSAARAVALHIARWDPSRVLAEVDAKRRIADEHGGRRYDPCDEHDSSLRSIPCTTVRLLTLPYAEHADYDPAWAPEMVEP